MAKRGFGGLKASLRRLSGGNLMSKGALNQGRGMFAAVTSAMMPPAMPVFNLALGAVGAATALYGASQTYRGDKLLSSANRASRIEAMRQKRAGVAKGASGRSGKAMQRASVGGRRVASAAPAGGDGSVKGYYRVQAGKSVFVSGYQRV